MLPLFRPGDLALTARRTLRRGDCAAYRWRGRTLLHRVAGFSGGKVLFRDDARELPPHAVAPAAIFGRVLSRDPRKSGAAGYLYFRARGILKCLKKLPCWRD